MAGAGYVGLATAIGLAREGHHVDLVDIDVERAGAIAQGIVPFHEPSLQSALAAAPAGERLTVISRYPARFEDPSFAFVCVEADGAGGPIGIGPIASATRSLAQACPSDTVIVIRSTANPGTALQLQQSLHDEGYKQDLLVNPEFLREGSALEDFCRPSRVVIGGVEPYLRRRLAGLYGFMHAPVIETDPTSAELIKLASNSALAVRVSLANEIADLAIATGADVDAVLEGVGADPRIGSDYLRAGIGFGGYCLPKDLDALRSLPVPTPILDGAAATNARAAARVVEAVIASLPSGSTIGISGLGFKPGTDSIRGSRALVIVESLLQKGYNVVGCDPLAEENVRRALGSRITYASSAEEAAGLADGIVLAHPVPRRRVEALRALTGIVWDELGVLQTAAREEAETL
ncbi:MAG: nucleotide sugar dehydrogenase [Dehalococcoidia bacterium]